MTHTFVCGVCGASARHLGDPAALGWGMYQDLERDTAFVHLDTERDLDHQVAYPVPWIFIPNLPLGARGEGPRVEVGEESRIATVAAPSPPPRPARWCVPRWLGELRLRVSKVVLIVRRILARVFGT